MGEEPGGCPLERVKLRIKPQHYQIFYLSAVKGLETRKIAMMLKVNAGRVYLIRHRVSALLKQEITRLRNREDPALFAHSSQARA